MIRLAPQLFTIVSICIAATLAPACKSSGAIDPGTPTPVVGASTELSLLKFTNYRFDATADAQYFGYVGEDQAFDTVMLYGLTHGQFKEQTQFKLYGRPTHAKPTKIVLSVGGGGAQLTRRVDADPKRFIVSVDATWNDDLSLNVIAYQDDGTRAPVK